MYETRNVLDYLWLLKPGRVPSVPTGTYLGTWVLKAGPKVYTCIVVRTSGGSVHSMVSSGSLPAEVLLRTVLLYTVLL